MNRQILLLGILFFTTDTLLAGPERKHTVDLGAAVANSQGTFTAASNLFWQFGKKRKFEAGIGARLSWYIGANQYYITAPAQITSGSTGPGVFFKENISENIDTFLIAKPRVLAFNALIYLGYNFSQKFSVVFNIDAIGFTLGKDKRGNYINGFTGQMINSSPTAFNLLLISDNDLGSLNSELYGKYQLNEKWAIRAGMQFLFTEYTTDTKVQQFPEPNDRFRKKSLMFMVGTALALN